MRLVTQKQIYQVNCLDGVLKMSYETVITYCKSYKFSNLTSFSYYKYKSK